MAATASATNAAHDPVRTSSQSITSGSCSARAAATCRGASPISVISCASGGRVSNNEARALRYCVQTRGAQVSRASDQMCGSVRACGKTQTLCQLRLCVFARDHAPSKATRQGRHGGRGKRPASVKVLPNVARGRIAELVGHRAHPARPPEVSKSTPVDIDAGPGNGSRSAALL